MRITPLSCLSLLLAVQPLVAQAPPPALSAEDELMALLNTPITVASQKAMTTREAPGIVSLVTREEILASGARDLLEVLRLVPGFDFASDIQGVVGPAVRGNWAFEGKLLLLLDGQELNEARYGTTQFGNHISVDQIRQIEIIRGPGSAIYGGTAELAVVNVITRAGRDLNGVSGALTLARTSQNWSRRTGNVAYGSIEGDLEFSLSASGGRATRSDQPWNSFGNVRLLQDESKLNQGLLNLGLKYRGLSLRAIHDTYEIQDWTYFLPTSPTPMRFQGTYLEGKYAWELSPSFSLTPHLGYKTQQPWYYPDQGPARQRETNRLTLGLLSQWDPNATFSLSSGGDWWKDEGRTKVGTWSNGKATIAYTNWALFTQGLLRSGLGNLTLGARYDSNSQFGTSFVPRVALTKAWDTFHLKLLASRAFRAPAIENFELNKTVKPEKTTALEVEFGAQLGRGTFCSVNFFDISIKNPMVYAYDSNTGDETYRNHPRSGTRGMEVDLQKRGEWGFLRSTLTLSRANDNQVPDYVVPGQSTYMVGLPNVKVTLLASFKLGDNFSFAPSVIGIGPRYTFESDGGPHLRESSTLINAMLHYRHPGSPFQVTLGSHNLTGAQVGFPKAYQGTDGDTYPSHGQEFFLRIAYNY